MVPTSYTRLALGSVGISWHYICKVLLCWIECKTTVNWISERAVLVYEKRASKRAIQVVRVDRGATELGEAQKTGVE